jgi:Lon protease-like protein
MSDPDGDGAATAAVTIPLFPLNIVLFPRGPLSLRIFEARYVDMVRRCMRQGTGFGVVLLERPGPETDPAAHIATVGTLATIEDFSQLPDGLLGLACVGSRRFRVLRRWRQDDGLNVGEVAWIADEPGGAVPVEHLPLAELLRKLLPQLGDAYRVADARWEDASWVGSRLAEILPLPRAQKQALLELEDPLERLQRIAPLLRRA